VSKPEGAVRDGEKAMTLRSHADFRRRGRGKVDFSGIAQAALSHAEALLRRWLPDGRRQVGEWVARNPRRSDRHAGSFRVNMLTGRWADFAIGVAGGDLISLAAYLFGIDQAEAACCIADMLGLRHD
jgi:hypothetical protein